MSVKKGGVDICKIAEGSAAAKDGRLKVNDHLLQINNQNTTNMSADDVMKILKGAKSSVKLVVARMVTGQVQPTKGLVVNEVILYTHTHRQMHAHTLTHTYAHTHRERECSQLSRVICYIA